MVEEQLQEVFVGQGIFDLVVFRPLHEDECNFVNDFANEYLNLVDFRVHFTYIRGSKHGVVWAVSQVSQRQKQDLLRYLDQVYILDLVFLLEFLQRHRP